MRIGLAFKAFFRILSNQEFASGVEGLFTPQTPALPEGKPEPPAPAVPPGAVGVLVLLQREGRLVDFLQESLEGFPDDQVGAVARGVHEGCRKVLKEYLEVHPVLEQSEGDAVTVEAGFDPSATRLVGRVEGDPPFQGTLRHHGWRLKSAKLPDLPKESDTTIIVPAEVEIP